MSAQGECWRRRHRASGGLTQREGKIRFAHGVDSCGGGARRRYSADAAPRHRWPRQVREDCAFERRRDDANEDRLKVGRRRGSDVPRAAEAGAAAERSEASASRVGQDGGSKSYWCITSGRRTPKPAVVANEHGCPVFGRMRKSRQGTGNRKPPSPRLRRSRQRIVHFPLAIRAEI